MTLIHRPKVSLNRDCTLLLVEGQNFHRPSIRGCTRKSEKTQMVSSKGCCYNRLGDQCIRRSLQHPAMFTFYAAAITGKSFSKALILESVNPKYDDRLFIDSRLQYKKNTSWEHVVYKNCFVCQNKNKKQFLYTMGSQLVFFLYWSRESTNNLLSYCGLTQGK